MPSGSGSTSRQRAVVYYTALLVNVGCHTDAHEQAKWFGDDIALKAIKYDHELAASAVAAAAMRRLGAGNPPLHRFRIGLSSSVSGHREIDGMIAQHAAMARLLGEQLGLADEVLEALGAAYEQWDGRGWPGELKGEAVPIASRLAQLAEFVEVAHRLGGVEAAKALARQARWQAVRPRPRGGHVCARRRCILSGLDAVATWDAVIDAEPALAVVLSGERFDAALLAIANFVDLKSPYTLGHARAVADLAAAAGAQLGLAEPDVRALRARRARARPRPARGVERDLGQARAARRGRVGAGADVIRT